MVPSGNGGGGSSSSSNNNNNNIPAMSREMKRTGSFSFNVIVQQVHVVAAMLNQIHFLKWHHRTQAAEFKFLLHLKLIFCYEPL